MFGQRAFQVKNNDVRPPAAISTTYLELIMAYIMLEPASAPPGYHAVPQTFT